MMAWIKVTDRMPPNGMMLIVTVEINGKKMVEYDVAWNNRKQEWAWVKFGKQPEYGSLKNSPIKVTHWMPMPKPAED